MVLFGTETLLQSNCCAALPNAARIPQFGTINVRLAAVRRLAYEAADAGLRRVKGAKKLGIRLGNWLSASEARALWRSPDADTLKGKRDRAIIAVLLGCGLRRRELADLTFDHLHGMTEKVVWYVVKTYGKRLEIP